MVKRVKIHYPERNGGGTISRSFSTEHLYVRYVSNYHGPRHFPPSALSIDVDEQLDIIRITELDGNVQTIHGFAYETNDFSDTMTEEEYNESRKGWDEHIENINQYNELFHPNKTS